MYTDDVAQMLCKPPSHIGLICHFIHKVQEKIRGKDSTFQILVIEFLSSFRKGFMAEFIH